MRHLALLIAAVVVVLNYTACTPERASGGIADLDRWHADGGPVDAVVIDAPTHDTSQQDGATVDATASDRVAMDAEHDATLADHQVSDTADQDASFIDALVVADVTAFDLAVADATASDSTVSDATASDSTVADATASDASVGDGQSIVDATANNDAVVEDCRIDAALCLGMHYCDPLDGLCKAGCNDSSQCGATQICNLLTNTCESCDDNTLKCQGQCAQCPDDANVLSFTCEENNCIVGRCVFDTKLCEGACAVCPDDPQATAFGCNQTLCEPTACEDGFLPCAGTCTNCPLGANATRCEEETCVATACDQPYILYQGDCLSWSAEIIDSNFDSLSHGDGQIVLDSEGKAYVSFFDPKEGQHSLAYKDLNTWKQRSILTSDYSAGAALDIDSSGYLHIAYWSGNDVYYLRLHQDHIASATDEEVLVDEAFASKISIKAESRYRSHLSYQGEYLDMVYAKSYPSWSTVKVERPGVIGDHSSIALDSSMLPRIAYQNNELDEVHYASFDGTSWTIETVVEDLGSQITLQLDSHNQAHILYSGTEGLTYTWKDSSGWHRFVIGLYVGNETGFELDVEGHAHMVYYKSGSGLIWGQFAEGAYSEQVVNAENQFFSAIAMTLDARQLPQFVYSIYNPINRANEMRYIKLVGQR